MFIGNLSHSSSHDMHATLGKGYCPILSFKNKGSSILSLESKDSELSVSRGVLYRAQSSWLGQLGL